MKMQSIILVLSIGFFGSLLSMGDTPKVVLFHSDRNFYNSGDVVRPTQTRIDTSGQRVAQDVGELEFVSSKFLKGTSLIVDVETNNQQFLDRDNIWQYNKTKKLWEVTTQSISNVIRKNWVQSLGDALSGFVIDNVWVQMIAAIGCGRSISCLTWAAGTPALTNQYLAWHLLIGSSASGLSKISGVGNDSLFGVCFLSAVIGLLNR